MVAQIAQPDGQAKEGALKMEEITDKDPEAINKLAAAEKIRLAELEKQNADMDDILNIKTQDKAFQKEIGNYAKPSWKIGVGCLMVVIVGCTATLFGWFIMEVMTILNIAPLLG
jgi:ribosomal protein L39E|mmetsp:Transcript_11191/g.15070  ORF Transcript_11191/g.15070 Transcript_11191/m.15070 type:complete len:114 (-) Transcript_11191:2004-2345(-)